jgi:mono/diheme cytochrome c family protein
MKSLARLSASAFTLLALPMLLPLIILPPVVLAGEPARQPDPFADPYAEHCAACHGAHLEGAAQGTPLAGVALRRGDSMESLMKSIRDGVPGTPMPAFARTLDEVQVKRLATYISETRHVPAG